MCSRSPLIEGLLQVVEVYLDVNERCLRAYTLCESACSHPWITTDAAAKLKVTGPRIKLTVNGMGSIRTVETEIVDLTV